jgi:hypothetical protein
MATQLLHVRCRAMSESTSDAVRGPMTVLGLPGMPPQRPLLGANENRDARREPVSQAVTLAPGGRTSHILTAFAKRVSPHSYKGRMKSDWVWIARPLRSRHFRP